MTEIHLCGRYILRSSAQDIKKQKTLNYDAGGCVSHALDPRYPQFLRLLGRTDKSTCHNGYLFPQTLDKYSASTGDINTSMTTTA
ncbi:uncharacterized protein PAC_11229 [Phialocephala subalpina]|uniref:Uncharacterized protein n=1 Tax=Phialocephala subalpina TaxID=576137 RepID=A0A1L7X8I3_9HELO|nr:uncharacterized protein PAC_11229 [Phialocephala subalpina]